MDKRTDKKRIYIRPKMDVIALEAEDFTDIIMTNELPMQPIGGGGTGSQSETHDLTGTEMDWDEIIHSSNN